MSKFDDKYKKLELRAYFHRNDENFNIVIEVDRELTYNELFSRLIENMSSEYFNKPDTIIISEFYKDDDNSKIYKNCQMISGEKLKMLWKEYLRRRRERLLDKSV